MVSTGRQGLGEQEACIVSEQSKHTPGPWQVDWVIDGAFQISGTSEGDKCVLAQRASFPERHFEFVGNAHLIAAAPEMKDALKALMTACVKADSIGELSAEVDGSLIDAARQALAKAEGRDQ